MSWQTSSTVSAVLGGGQAALQAAAAAAQEKQWGVSKPISIKPATEQDRKETNVLEEVLRARGLFESDEEGEQREQALGMLNELVQNWMVEEGVQQGLLEAGSDSSVQPGKFYTFGSFRLGVHGPGADMDTLVVGPHYITRAVFFERFTKRLEERTDVVTELTVSHRLRSRLKWIVCKLASLTSLRAVCSSTGSNVPVDRPELEFVLIQYL
jgi:hypothetical protein